MGESKNLHKKARTRSTDRVRKERQNWGNARKVSQAQWPTTLGWVMAWQGLDQISSYPFHIPSTYCAKSTER